MKELKLKAWNKREKRMLQVLDIYFLQNVVRCYNEQARKKDKEYGCYFEWKLIDKTLIVQKKGPAKPKNEEITILLLYIERKDKNGTEIYEGDILRNTKQGSTISRNTGKLIKNGYDYKVITSIRTALFYPNKWEIIGNIYENPKLISSSLQEQK